LWKGRAAARGALDRLARDRPELREAAGELAWIPIQPPRPNKSGAWRLDFTAELLQGGLFNS
jgi:hypothetical protein